MECRTWIRSMELWVLDENVDEVDGVDNVDADKTDPRDER